MIQENHHNIPVKGFQIGLYLTTILLLFGRAYQHLFFEAPYRAFFLDETQFGWALAKFTDQTWGDYSLSLQTDAAIQQFGILVGIWFVMTLVGLFLRSRFLWITNSLLVFSSLLLFFLAYCYYLDLSYQIGQWIEYTSQFLTPLILMFFLTKLPLPQLNWIIKIAVALTFLGHGLYAIGYHPVPGNFVEMIITSLGLSNEEAKSMLLIAGILDMLVVVGVFIPKVDRWALGYALVWGFLTAAARLTSNIYFNHLFWMTVHQSVFEFLVRVPHFMLPFLGLQILRLTKSKDFVKSAGLVSS